MKAKVISGSVFLIGYMIVKSILGLSTLFAVGGGVLAVVCFWVMASDNKSSSSFSNDSVDLFNPDHIALLDEIKSAYGSHLSDGLGSYKACIYAPASALPHSKHDIRLALSALLDFAEDRRQSPLLDDTLREPEMIDVLSTCLVRLDDFLDVSPEQLPTEPRENVRVGLQLQKEELRQI